MKKLMFTLMAVMLAAVNANAMSYEQARNEALFLTDKMAYELNLTDAQYEAAYEINLDYLMGVTSQADVYGPYWERRNLDLSYILFTWQWDLFRAATYFYRPLYWNAGYWHFGIYARYPHRDYFYFGRPHFYATYRGGHSWRMNGGRSYYEGRHHIYRPEGHSRNNHFGMRNGWDRGDYRGDRGGHRSSTQITGDRHGGGSRGNNNGGSFGDGTRGGRNNGGSFDGNRGGRNNGGSFDGNRGGHNNGGSFDGNRGGHNNGGSFDGNRGGRNNGGSFDGNRGGSNNGGSFGGGNRGGSNNGGSFGGGSRGGSNNGGGSFGGGTRGGNSGGSFGGGSRGGGHSGGGSVGAGSRGGGHSGGGRSGRR